MLHSSILGPLVDALTLEGYYYFLPPCYKTSDNKSCTMGTKWSQTSQQIMGSLNYTIQSTDLFFPADQIIPDPLPRILNNCYKPPVANCILDTETVSEAVYDNGNTALGASSPAKPALHIPEPLSHTKAAISSSHIFYFVLKLTFIYFYSNNYYLF